MGNQLASGIQGSLLACLFLTLSSACVTQARYEEAVAEARNYQIQNQDLSSYQGLLEAENKRLEGELDLRQSEPIEAGVTRDYDQRIAEITRMMESLGVAPGDLTLLRVDGGYGVRLDDSILFDSGSPDLKEEGQALLLKVAMAIEERGYERVWIRGHTDSDPIVRAATKARFPGGNLQLSAARALEVATLLAEKGGIPRSKLVVAGFGSSDPVAPNTSAGDKRQNRRVEIFVIQEGTGATPGE